jgi:hypothetical protein
MCWRANERVLGLVPDLLRDWKLQGNICYYYYCNQRKMFFKHFLGFFFLFCIVVLLEKMILKINSVLHLEGEFKQDAMI